MTYTYAELEVSKACFEEIEGLLREAEYEHSFQPNGVIDMHGIALKKKSDFSSAFTCGPSRPSCKCECPDGKCGHKWDGPIVDGGLVATASCSKCGMTAMDHDLWVAP